MTRKKIQGLVPAAFLDELTQYSVPKAPAPTDLKLDANEGAAPPSSLFNVLSESGSEKINRYPKASILEALIAERMGIDSRQVMVTAGGDDAIMRCCRVYLHKRREMILPQPSFEMLTKFTQLAEGRIVDVPWKEDEFPTGEVIAAVNENTGIITVTSPNNPTGCVAKAEDLRRISEAAPSALLLADLAYTHFADENLTETILNLANAIGIYSFSKAWGLAGLRVGFAVGPVELIEPLRRVGLPYAVSSISLALAQKWFVSGQAHVAQYVLQVLSERQRLQRLLRSFGAKLTKSQANFAFARFDDPLWIRDALGGLGIAIRYIPSRNESSGGVRIGCPGDEADFTRLTHALEVTCRPQALIVKLETFTPNHEELQKLTERRLMTVISDKDASLKSAMEKLKVQRAWMIADTPKDIAAARRAGVLPIGLIAPGNELEITKTALYAAGSARVFDNLQQLEDVLP